MFHVECISVIAISVFIPSAFLSGAFLWALLSVRNTAGVVIFASFYGFFSGALFSLVFPAVATFGTVNDIGCASSYNLCNLTQ